MKMRKGKTTYKLPPYGQILGATVRYGMGPHFNLMQIRDGTHDRKTTGEPRFFLLLDDKIEVLPKPDKGGDLTVRYFPPVQEA